MSVREPSTRSGQYVSQPGGYRAFIPAPLPPSLPLDLSGELATLLSQADRVLGRLHYAPYIALFAENQPSQETDA